MTLAFNEFYLLQNAIWALLVTIVKYLVATLAMVTTVKVNATVMKFTVTQLLDVKVHSKY